ncbi:MAG: glycosyltransferase family 4 protein [Bacteroidia bacterium]|nr:glycosyltransferase family 4 protein [Bacteroidia bacterium]
MKILQITNKIPYPPADGGAIAVLNLAKGLAMYGHEITMLAMNTSKHYFDPALLPAEITNLIRIETIAVDNHLSFIGSVRNFIFSKLPYTASRFLSREFSRKLSGLLLSGKFDIVQAEGLYMGQYFPEIKENSDALIALRIHNIEHEIWARVADGENNLLKKWYLMNLTKRIRLFKSAILNRYDLLIPITQRDADVYNNLGNSKPICVTPAGINIAELPAISVPSEKNTLFHIGAMDWAPNQEGLRWFFDNVWRNILTVLPDLRFHLAGRNAPAWLLTYFSKQPNVIWHGEVDDAYRFMNSYSLMVVPLLSGSGMRVKIIEGMALGKTIVTTETGAEGIDVTTGENILIAGDAQDFSSAVIRAMTDDQFFDQLGRNARVFVTNNYDNQKITAKLADFYKQSMSSH